MLLLYVKLLKLTIKKKEKKKILPIDTLFESVL